MQPALKIALATAGYGLLHSALASRAAKRAAARIFGEQRQRALYRPFFIAQAAVTTAALGAYGLRLPARTLYRIHGPAAWLLRAAQAAALAHAFVAAREVGLARITGLESLAAWARGEEVPESPAAQGPELDPSTGELTDGGPFRWSRHPLNLSPVPFFWLTPHLTTRRLAFNLAGSAYLVLGSLHEESRLRAAYGGRYRAYQSSGVPFFLPAPRALRGRSA